MYVGSLKMLSTFECLKYPSPTWIYPWGVVGSVRCVYEKDIKLAETETVIADLKTEKESISLFGIQFEKTTFKTLFFLIVVGLIGALLFFITKFKQSNIITTQSKLSLKQVEEEFAIYKEKALEREQKAMRRLQDELNKNKKES